MRPTRIKWRAELSQCIYLSIHAKRASTGGSDELKKKVLAWLKKTILEQRERGRLQNDRLSYQTSFPFFFFVVCDFCGWQKLNGCELTQENFAFSGTQNLEAGEKASFSVDEQSVKLSQVISHCFARTPSHHYPPPSPLPRLPLALVCARQGHIITCHSFSALVNCRVNLPTRSDCANWEGHAW